MIGRPAVFCYPLLWYFRAHNNASPRSGDLFLGLLGSKSDLLEVLGISLRTALHRVLVMVLMAFIC